WNENDLRDKLPERYRAVLDLTQDNPSEVLSKQIREYVSSVEEDSEIIDEFEASLKRSHPRAEKIIGRFHYLRRFGEIRESAQMSYAQERRQEILDGRKSWNKNNHAAGDGDLFYTQFVLPLRELRDSGLFEGLYEYRGSDR